MKANARQYTESLLAAYTQGGQDTKVLVNSLVQILRKKRQGSLLKKILAELIERETEAKGEVAVTIETAHEPEVATKKELLGEAEKMYPGKKIQATYVVLPELESGFRIRSKDKELDQSLKTKLHKLRNNLTRL